MKIQNIINAIIMGSLIPISMLDWPNWQMIAVIVLVGAANLAGYWEGCDDIAKWFMQEQDKP